MGARTHEFYRDRISFKELVATMRATGPEVAACRHAVQAMLEFEAWLWSTNGYVVRNGYKGRSAEQVLAEDLPWLGEKRRRMLESAVIQLAHEIRGPVGAARQQRGAA